MSYVLGIKGKINYDKYNRIKKTKIENINRRTKRIIIKAAKIDIIPKMN